MAKPNVSFVEHHATNHAHQRTTHRLFSGVPENSAAYKQHVLQTRIHGFRDQEYNRRVERDIQEAKRRADELANSALENAVNVAIDRYVEIVDAVMARY